MDNYSVKITPQAQTQMLEIFSYISNNLKEPSTATYLLDELQRNILALSSFPKRMTLVNEEPWKSYGIHKMVVKNFIVYFWVNDEQKEVHITAVIYGKREQLEQLRQMNI